jgi:hypothetical protein
MNSLPNLAKRVQRFGQLVLDPCYVAAGESVVLPKLDRAVRAVQIEESLASSPDHVNTGRAVVVEIDNHAQARKSEYCRQIYSTIFPSAWDIELQT